MTYKFFSQSFVENMLTWCGKCHIQKNVFMQQEAEEIFEPLARFCVIIVKFCTAAMILSQVIIDLGAAGFTFFVFGVDSYVLGLPYHFPFLQPNSPEAYFITWTHQLLAQVQECVYLGCYASVLYSYALYLMKQFDVVEKIISQVPSSDDRENFQEWIKVVVDNTNDLKT